MVFAVFGAVLEAFGVAFAVSLDALFSGRFLWAKRVMTPSKIPCKTERRKIGNQSKKAWLKPKIARKLSPRILKLPVKPVAAMSSNLAVPPESRFIRSPKKRKLGVKPYQKVFSRVASRMPRPAKTNSSSHFLQFI